MIDALSRRHPPTQDGSRADASSWTNAAKAGSILYATRRRRRNWRDNNQKQVSFFLVCVLTCMLAVKRDLRTGSYLFNVSIHSVTCDCASKITNLHTPKKPSYFKIHLSTNTHTNTHTNLIYFQQTCGCLIFLHRNVSLEALRYMSKSTAGVWRILWKPGVASSWSHRCVGAMKKGTASTRMMTNSDVR